MSIFQKIEQKRTNKLNKLTSLDFVSIGLACHAICLLEKATLLKRLSGGLTQKDISSSSNPALIRSAIITLLGSKVVEYKKEAFILTSLGNKLLEDLGSIMLPFHGYRKLLAKQYDLLNHPNDWDDTDIDFLSIAEASSNFGSRDLLPLLYNVFEHIIKPKGTICDLGCGVGDKLLSICSHLKKPGLGVEKSKETVKQAKNFLSNQNDIEIIKGDIKKLDGIWEDVDVVMVNFVYHDFSTKESLKFLKNIKTNFPRLKFLVISDIVSFSEKHSSIFPGFDYVHGCQGITVRDFSEIKSSFKFGNYSINFECQVENMPNTYVWVLQPKD